MSDGLKWYKLKSGQLPPAQLWSCWKRRAPSLSIQPFPTSFRQVNRGDKVGKWAWGVPSLSKICDIYHLLCVWIFRSFVGFPFMYLLQSNTSLLDSLSSDEGLKRKGERGGFSSIFLTMQWKGAVLFSLLQWGRQPRSVFCRKPQTRRMLFTWYSRRATKTAWKTSHPLTG